MLPKSRLCEVSRVESLVFLLVHFEHFFELGADGVEVHLELVVLLLLGGAFVQATELLLDVFDGSEVLHRIAHSSNYLCPTNNKMKKINTRINFP